MRGLRRTVLAALALGAAAGASALPDISAARPCLKGDLINLYGNCAKKSTAAAPGTARRNVTFLRPGSRPGSWQMHRIGRKPDSSDAVVLELDADRAGPRGQPPATLLLRCQGERTNLMIAFAGRTMSDRREKSELLYRLDGGPEQIIELSLSQDPSVMGIWQGFRAVPFIQRLAQAKTLRVSGWDAAGARIDLAFGVSGLEQALIPLRRACNW